MVLCSVTLTDLQTRRAGLSASAELLVDNVIIAISLIISNVSPATTVDVFVYLHHRLY